MGHIVPGFVGSYEAFTPGLIIPKNADVRVRAIGSTNNLQVTSNFGGYLASVV